MLVALLAAVGAAGCAKARAETLVAGGPPLDVPAPPPRVLAPVELEAVSATAGVPPAGAPEVPPSSPPAPPTPNATAARPAPAVAEPPAGDAPAASAESPRELRVVPSKEDVALEQRFRTALANANRDLARVDPQRLSNNAQEAYAQARRHLEMAEEAFRKRDLLYAVHLAQAGATVAGQLVPTR